MRFLNYVSGNIEICWHGKWSGRGHRSRLYCEKIDAQQRNGFWSLAFNSCKGAEGSRVKKKTWVRGCGPSNFTYNWQRIFFMLFFVSVSFSLEDNTCVFKHFVRLFSPGNVGRKDTFLSEHGAQSFVTDSSLTFLTSWTSLSRLYENRLYWMSISLSLCSSLSLSLAPASF